MAGKRNILIVGGGTAGWLTAAYLARALDLPVNGNFTITLLESPEIGIIGVGEGAFPTIRTTLQFLGIDEHRFIRKTSAAFKQGIRFVDWVHTPAEGRHSHFFHPFEAPFYSEDANLVSYWLLQDEATRPPFAEAVTFQNRVAEAKRGPKRSHEGDFAGPLNYAYHFDAGEPGGDPRRARARTGGPPCPRPDDRRRARRDRGDRPCRHPAERPARGRPLCRLLGLPRRADRRRARQSVQAGAAHRCSPTARSPARFPTTGPTRRSKAIRSRRRTRPAGPGTSASPARAASAASIRATI